eukprot:CAMPEP_0168606826 /NCGR_PEP_ID=MMETSP0420-20121227/16799_1 /TAXON_ID=498008 /ORGANISM="Pessonella sp." /LENGTH=660 /DNA_ID=CAMNT_0008646559 /DNA_START=213 /DNA_END=2191 /DNA_ORIENTATION=+
MSSENNTVVDTTTQETSSLNNTNSTNVATTTESTPVSNAQSSSNIADASSSPTNARQYSTSSSTSPSKPKENVLQTDLDQQYPPIVVPVVPRLKLLNLPFRQDKKWFKKELAKRGVTQYKSLKKISRAEWGQIAFENEKDRETALAKLKNIEIKGRQIEVSKYDASENNNQNKKRNSRDDNNPRNKRARKDGGEQKEKTISDVIMPWHNIPYEEQLQRKQRALTEIMRRTQVSTRRNAKQDRNAPPAWLAALGADDPLCPLLPIHPTDEAFRELYRNKYSFTIGFDHDGNKVVGQRFGQTKEGNSAVIAPDDNSGVDPAIEKARKAAEKIVKESDLEIYDTFKHSGFWRSVTVHGWSTGDVAVMFVVSHAGYTERQVQNEIAKIAAVKDCWTSVHLQRHQGANNMPSDDAIVQHIGGEPYTYEVLLGRRFRISPNAFFQVNRTTTEQMYDYCTKLAVNGVTDKQKTIGLDVCCGTGTLALFMAEHVDQVYGIELVKDAVKDAQFNAELNKCDNVTFVQGYVEKVLPYRIDDWARDAERVVAIVDLAAGLHPDVLKALRRTSQVTHLVYISCNQEALVRDLPALVKPETKNFAGEPFRPIFAKAFDMFPQSAHMEAAVLLVRGPQTADALKDVEQQLQTLKNQSNSEKKTENDNDTSTNEM